VQPGQGVSPGQLAELVQLLLGLLDLVERVDNLRPHGPLGADQSLEGCQVA
jgi:hypothetical protein